MTGLEVQMKKLGIELDTKWKPKFCKIMEAPGVRPIPDDVHKDFVQDRYAIMMSISCRPCLLFG
jgi:hypothetical protein